MKRTAPEICPACGAEVPPRALACPDCGADEKTGWNEEATQYDGLDLPGESNDDDEASYEEGRLRTRPKGVPWYWWLLAIVLLAALALAILTGRW